MLVALVIQPAMRMRRIVLSSEACLAQKYFSALSRKRRDFGTKNIIEHRFRVRHPRRFVSNHKCIYV